MTQNKWRTCIKEHSVGTKNFLINNAAIIDITVVKYLYIPALIDNDWMNHFFTWYSFILLAIDLCSRSKNMIPQPVLYVDKIYFKRYAILFSISNLLLKYCQIIY